MILQFLKDFKVDVDRRFDAVKTDLEASIDSVKTDLEARIDSVDQKIDSVESKLESKIDSAKSELVVKIDSVNQRIDDVKYDLRLDSQKLEKVYEARDKVKVTFGWQWSAASFVIAALAVGLAKVLVF